MAWLDNIQFSNQPIPEPSVSVYPLGALLLGGGARIRKSSFRVLILGVLQLRGRNAFPSARRLAVVGG
jgi:hypothetical protein